MLKISIDKSKQRLFSTMAEWGCSAASNEGLVENLARGGLVKSSAVKDAMLAVDRGNFTPVNPYEDSPQLLESGQTISAPHMHAHALELLAPNLVPGSKALDVGVGSGYLAACMAVMVGLTGSVVGIDRFASLVARSDANIRRGNADLLEWLTLSHTDGYLGHPDGPFDCIHVGAAAPEVPGALTAQLTVGGRMVIPVGPDGGNQVLLQIDRVSEDSVEAKPLMGVRYVPLLPDLA